MFVFAALVLCKNLNIVAGMRCSPDFFRSMNVNGEMIRINNLPDANLHNSFVVVVVPSRLKYLNLRGRPNLRISYPGKRRISFDLKSRTKDPVPLACLPRFCYRVRRGDEVERRMALLKANMAVLSEECDVALSPEGRLILAGLVWVPHKALCDCLIFDRRPQHFREERLHWIHLPLGTSTM